MAEPYYVKIGSEPPHRRLRDKICSGNFTKSREPPHRRIKMVLVSDKNHLQKMTLSIYLKIKKIRIAENEQDLVYNLLPLY